MKQIYKYIAIIILLVVVFFMGKCCQPEPPKSQDQLKAKVSTLKQDEKKLKAEIVYKDSVTHHHHHHWHEVRHDSLIPCPEKLAVADTVIRADSSLIVSLKQDIKALDRIVLTQDTIIKQDSIALKSNKKFWNGFKWGLGIGLGAGAVIGSRISGK